MNGEQERKRVREGQSKAARVRKKDIRRVVCQAAGRVSDWLSVRFVFTWERAGDL